MVHLVFKHPPRVSEPPEHVLNMLDTLLGEVESLREELSVNTESGRSGSADSSSSRSGAAHSVSAPWKKAGDRTTFSQTLE